jgi:XTP/dITP diphosphohydrolase
VLGAKLLDLVQITEALHAPEGGDPWRREQTHASLAKYMLEEAYEAYDAIQAHDLGALREELGDVLLQVLLHARMAHDADPPWTVDDVAQTLSDKLVRRNPHVFGGASVADLDEIRANWERIKREEKAARLGPGATPSALDGVVLSQPALSLAAKILSRARDADIRLAVDPAGADPTDEEALGELLFALVARASERGLDPEAALRRVALRRADEVRAAEST